MAFLPVVIKGDSNTQLTGIAALIRSMPQRVQLSLATLLCTMIDSARASEKLVYSSAVPKPRKWDNAGRAGGRVGTLKHELTPDKYEVTLEIDGDEYDDDQINMYSGLAEQLAQSLILFPDELLSTLVVANGETATAYDGVAYFATTHKWPNGKNKTNQSNLQTGTGTAADKIEADFYTALAAMQSWKDDQSRLCIPATDLNGTDTLLVQHAPALNMAVNKVFGSTANGEPYDISSGVKSTLARRAVTFSDAHLTGNSWYLYSLKAPQGHKPFVFIDREAPSIEILGRGTEHFTKNGTILIAGRRRFGIGYGQFARAQKIKNS